MQLESYLLPSFGARDQLPRGLGVGEGKDKLLCKGPDPLPVNKQLGVGVL